MYTLFKNVFQNIFVTQKNYLKEYYIVLAFTLQSHYQIKQ